MKKILIIILLIAIFISACNKKEEEVKIIKKNETQETKETQKEDESTDSEGTKEREEKSTQKSSEKNIVISPEEAREYINEYVTVKGYIADIHIREKVAFLNFDKRYPDNPFTAVVFANKFADFGDLTVYKNKTVEVKGKIKEYRGKPEIIMNSTSQIKIIK